MKRLINKIIRADKILREKKFTTLAGTLSFFLILSIVPCTFICIYVIGLLNIDISYNPDLDKKLNYLILDLIVKANSKDFSFFFIISSIYSGSSLFVHIIRVGEIIYQKKREKVTLFNRITAILWLLIFIIFIIALVIFNVLLTNYVNLAFKGFFLKLISYFIYFFIIFMIALFLNQFIVPFSINYKKLNNGTLLTVILWIIVSYGFAIYIKYFSNFEFLYGTLSFIIVFLLYIYLLMQCFLVGVIYNFNHYQNKAESFKVKGTK